jgi:hypothetical protein
VGIDLNVFLEKTMCYWVWFLGIDWEFAVGKSEKGYIWAVFKLNMG